MNRLFHPVLSEEPARVTNLANKLMLRLERGRCEGVDLWKITLGQAISGGRLFRQTGGMQMMIMELPEF